MLCLYLLGQNCLHLTSKPYLGSETYSCKYVKLPNIHCTYLCMSKYYRNSVFVKNVWPANSALFIYVSTHCVETVKIAWLQSILLTQWCSGNASALGVRGPGFNSCLRQRFLCLIFFCIVVVAFLLFVQKHIICHNVLQFLFQCLFIKYA